MLCTHCNNDKEESEFYANRSRENGFSLVCKICDNVFKKESKVRAKAKNKCYTCKRKKLKHSTYCLFHWCRQLIRRQLQGNKIFVDYIEVDKLTLTMLGKLSNQNFKCAYSKLPLVPGVNASIDHKVPFSKTQNNEISNLVWIDSHLNRVKGSGSVEQAMKKFSVYTELVKTNEYPIYE